jgi:death-on-curing protein
MAAHYEDANIVHQAALLAIGISQAQAFVDGNKRTADAALELFLYINGVNFTADPLDVARELERVAEAGDRRAAAESFKQWLRAAIEA